MTISLKTIDDYIAQFDGDVRDRLVTIRHTVHDAVPQATEAISYGMPTFKLKGNLVHFAAFKNHIGFYPTPSAIVAFGRELTQFVTSKGAIQLPHDRALPLLLIRKIVAFRVAENLSKAGIV